MTTTIHKNFMNSRGWVQLIEYANPLCTTRKDSMFVVHDRASGEIPYRGRSRGNAEGIYFARIAKLQ